jgi:hypothetical protein
MHDCWSFGKCMHCGCPENWKIEQQWTEWVCPHSISNDIWTKEKIPICLTGMLLGTNYGCITTNSNQSISHCNRNISVHLQPKSSKFKVTSVAGKARLTVFWDSQGVLLAHFQKLLKIRNLRHMSTVKFCWSFRMLFAESVQANWQTGYCFVMTVPGPMQPKQPRREFKNYRGFADLRTSILTAWTWSQWLSSVWSAKIPSCGRCLADVEEIEMEVLK